MNSRISLTGLAAKDVRLSEQEGRTGLRLVSSAKSLQVDMSQKICIEDRDPLLGRELHM